MASLRVPRPSSSLMSRFSGLSKRSTASTSVSSKTDLRHRSPQVYDDILAEATMNKQLVDSLSKDLQSKETKLIAAQVQLDDQERMIAALKDFIQTAAHTDALRKSEERLCAAELRIQASKQELDALTKAIERERDEHEHQANDLFDQIDQEEANSRALQAQLAQAVEDKKRKKFFASHRKRSLLEAQSTIEKLESELRHAKLESHALAHDSENVAMLQARETLSAKANAELRKQLANSQAAESHLINILKRNISGLRVAEQIRVELTTNMLGITQKIRKLSHENTYLASKVVQCDIEKETQAARIADLGFRLAASDAAIVTERGGYAMSIESLKVRNTQERELFQSRNASQTFQIAELQRQLQSTMLAASKQEARQEALINSQQQDLRRLRLDMTGEVAKRCAEEYHKLEGQIEVNNMEIAEKDAQLQNMSLRLNRASFWVGKLLNGIHLLDQQIALEKKRKFVRLIWRTWDARRGQKVKDSLMKEEEKL